VHERRVISDPAGCLKCAGLHSYLDPNIGSGYLSETFPMHHLWPRGWPIIQVARQSFSNSTEQTRTCRCHSPGAVGETRASCTSLTVGQRTPFAYWTCVETMASCSIHLHRRSIVKALLYKNCCEYCPRQVPSACSDSELEDPQSSLVSFLASLPSSQILMVRQLWCTAPELSLSRLSPRPQC
jgi:hypothetical protein